MESRGLSAVNFEFINVTAGSGGERRRNNHLARAHAAKINRQNFKSQADSRRSKQATTFSIRPKTRKESSITRSSIVEGSGSDGDTDDTRALTACSHDDASGHANDGVEDGYHNMGLEDPDPLPTPQTISPAYGALTIETFDWTSQPISAQVAHYLIKVSWPARSGTEVTRAWWSEFCRCPIIYHVAHLASAVHHDMLVGDSTWTSRPEVLTHKTKTIRLVNEDLERLDLLNGKAIDQLIFAVTTLARHEMEARHLQPGEVLLFTPHMPHANGMKPLGRLNWSNSARSLLVHLVNSRGGLHKLEIAGLGEMLALIDVLESSADMSKPRFPPLWTLPEPRDVERFAGIKQFPPGRGFVGLFDILPSQAIAAYQNLARADSIIAHYDLVPLEKDFGTILRIRNSAIHSVLSIPPWEELSANDLNETDFVLYEACRITAIIYSNAVLLGLPTHSGWHSRFVATLRDILKGLDLLTYMEISPALTTWILFVGSIASYRTPHRRFFESSLRESLCRTGMHSWGQVRQCLEEFLWSENACEHGAAVTWDAMNLENSWPS